jgi:heat shock protein HslJ
MQIVHNVRQVWMAAIALLIVIALAGCAGGAPRPPAEEPPDNAAAATPAEETTTEETEQEPTAADATDTMTDTALIGTTWEWVEFQDTAEQNSFTVEDSSAYTLTLAADETVSIQADCNRALGEYTLEGSSLSIALGPTTLVECGPESRYDEYLARLGEVVSYVIEDGQLFLNLQVDAGNLVFEPAAE